jgi:hypothetical protein
VRRSFRVGILLVSLAFAPATARAEWQVKPFGGVTFGGSTTLLIDFDEQVGKPKLNLGVSGLWLGDVFGLEGEVATTAGYFSGDPSSVDTLVLRSHVATVMGNAIVAMPKSISQYGLRPYAVAGLGGMHISVGDNQHAYPFASWLTAWDLGGGATGFLSDFVGLNWDVRFFKTLQSQPGGTGVSVGPGQLSFWRATMGISVRI